MCDCPQYCSMQVVILGGVFTKSLRLEEFNHVVTTAIGNFTTMLTDTWCATIKAHVKHCLTDVGKGWFNIHETSSEVYAFSKLRRFLTMVNFMMEDSLRKSVQTSLEDYARGIQTASDVDVHVSAVRFPCDPGHCGCPSLRLSSPMMLPYVH